MILAPWQILDLAISAGFAGQDAITATAIALAESGGDAFAHNPIPPDDSYGLWQINMIGLLRAKRLAAFGLPNVSALYDPATNARVAFSLYQGRGGRFVDWSTFTNGAYKRKLPSAQTAWVSRQAEAPNPVVNPPNPSTGPAPIPAAAGSTSQPEHSSTMPAAPPVEAVSHVGGFSSLLDLLRRLLSRGTK